MRRTTASINPALSHAIESAGHTDLIVIADAGLPIPPGSERIDLAYRPGAPAFLDVLDTVLAELVVERATVATETAQHSPGILAALHERLDALGVPIEQVPHEELKRLSRAARTFVRTGEYTPYANVILHAGVPF
ncbi:D-ribose pyranase [Microbacterium kribbense]|uniref:D-ribose pyranase n=1 Tax=Microbacterium kribbense TaxID=433645 RepID=A0ABP7G701_9MICO